MKNFALLETENDDYILNPAYDLIDTRIHVSDATFGLNGGLMPLSERSIGYRNTGSPGYDDFVNFAVSVGVATARVDKIFTPFVKRQPMVEELINHSYLANSVKKGYLLHYNNRRNLLTR